MSETPNGNPFADDPQDEERLDRTNEDKDTVPTGGPDTKDEEVDEWGEESFPASDPPANY